MCEAATISKEVRGTKDIVHLLNEREKVKSHRFSIVMADSMEREWCEYLNVRHAKLESKDSSDTDIPVKIYKVSSNEAVELS